MGHCAAASLFQRQSRLRPVQRLDRAFLVKTEHHRIVRRIHIQPHHIHQLVLELRIAAQLERPDQMRLQSIGNPHPVYKTVGGPHRPRHAATRPVRRIRRRGLGRRLDDLRTQSFLLPGILPAMVAAARTFLPDSRHPFLRKPIAPLTDGGLGHPQFGGNLLVGLSLR